MTESKFVWARRRGVKLFDISWHFRATSVHDKSWSKKSTTNSQFKTSHTFLLITQLTKRNYMSVYFQSSSRLYEKLIISCFCFSDQNNALTATHLTFKFEKKPMRYCHTSLHNFPLGLTQVSLVCSLGFLYSALFLSR